MDEPAKTTPGPNESESRRAVMQVLREANVPAMTSGMVSDEVDYSRRTVHSRLTDLQEDKLVQSAKIGGATAYWIEETPTPSSAPTTGRSRAVTGGLAAALFPVVAVLGAFAMSVVFFRRIFSERNIRAVTGRESKLLLANMILIVISVAFATGGFMWAIHSGELRFAAVGGGWLALGWTGLALEYLYFEGEVPGVPYTIAEHPHQPV